MAAAANESTPTEINSDAQPDCRCAVDVRCHAEHPADDHKNDELDADLRVIQLDAGGPRRRQGEAG